ncbi:hypothetical protein DVA67_032225 [Solirubrobacter sp. CPCC 204708]|uniref:GNAT family N-acetyltransferase n=1 Tax=Solirubrobacter deserti TaxID=2282478 RepID=A0ABT4RVN3_9ACTN|nr:hypothetical protein [Solirubrobacter deserti]MBE2320672.1 hypothetical protein [Solirubrobacter deserti]MDA0142423.1 hypothetical protein [Solirubrobacter deserti]
MSTVIRFADTHDAAALARLAALDSSVVPTAPQLIAIEDGALIAAISARDGAAIADPFSRSAGAVELLHRRAAQLSASDRPRRAALRLSPLPR